MKEMNANEYVTLAEANKRSKYSKRQIKKLAEKGIERIGTKKDKETGRVLYNIKHILQYEANHQKTPILDPVWDEMNHISGEAYFPLFGYDLKYFITNKCRVIDFSKGQVLTPRPHKDTKGKLTGYTVVWLMQDGKSKSEFLHRLMGKTQCPNVLGKNIFHHVERTKTNGLLNNKACNILPVWQHQHDELHKLLREDRKDEYRTMVKQIQEENLQKIYTIPHLDFESSEKFSYYMFVTIDGYMAYKAGENVPLNTIVGEKAEATNKTEGSN